MLAKKSLLVLLVSLTISALARDPMDDVDTIIGAKSEGGNLGGGKTFPGACVPFGMVQLSPDTITGGDNGAGYSYYHPSIEGFSFTHMSGVGAYGDLGNLLVMPMTGPLQFQSGINALDLYQGSVEGWRSGYSHSNEITRAGYYAVTLDRYKVRAEMSHDDSRRPAAVHVSRGHNSARADLTWPGVSADALAQNSPACWTITRLKAGCITKGMGAVSPPKRAILSISARSLINPCKPMASGTWERTLGLSRNTRGMTSVFMQLLSAAQALCA